MFTLASVLETAGAKAVLEKLGVDATGQVFNSIVAIEQMKGKEMNPFVNPGAIATTSLVEGATAEEKWARILAIHEAFAGRKLSIDEEVYRSEAATNDRNQAIAKLMHAYGRLYFDPAASTDVYTRQCSISVNASDLAVMAATLANGGRNPVTGKQVIASANVPRILAVMATAGLYDDSGIWLYEIGLPAKSGVGGGIIAVAPGRFGIAVFSPPLDAAGNSVRAQKAIRDVSAALGASPYDVKAPGRSAACSAAPYGPRFTRLARLETSMVRAFSAIWPEYCPALPRASSSMRWKTTLSWAASMRRPLA